MRFSLGGEIVDRFVSFVARERDIPPVIERLTGITLADLEGAPPAAAVLERLAAFVGGEWVVGHNVLFDANFLEGQGFPALVSRLDTAELAAIVLPTAPSYALARLAADLAGEHRAHRALEDAEAAARLLQHLFAETVGLSLATLEGLLQLSESLSEPVRWFLTEALAAKARTTFAARDPNTPREPIEDAGPARSAPLSRAAGVSLPGADERAGIGGVRPNGVTASGSRGAAVGVGAGEVPLRELFAADGPVARAFDEFEQRPEQLEMAEAVERAMVDGGALVVEAGTGTGKSLAYLVPALRAAARGKRVLVSTYTTTLQDQLAASDLPRLVGALGLDLEVAVLKGRANYLCPRRWHLFRLAISAPDEARFAMKTLVWRDRTRTGDRAELNLLGSGEQALWPRVCAEDETCTAKRCALVRGGCYLERARAAAAAAPLVVVNHALALSDARARNRLLPDVDVVVVDEAHQLDEVASQVYGTRIAAIDVRRAVQRAAQAAGALVSDDARAALRDEGQQALLTLEETFVALSRLMRDPSERGYEDQRRITSAVRGADEWLAVELAAERLRDALAGMARAGQRALDAAHDPGQADEAVELESALAELVGLEVSLGRVVHAPRAGEICWVALEQGGALSLQSAPAHAGTYIDRALTRSRHASIFTSATLAVAGTFDFVLDRFGLGDRAATLRVGTSFDYASQSLLVLPSGLVDPWDPAFVPQTAAVVADIAARLRGRTLVLFTSHSMLRAVNAVLAPLLDPERIGVLAQSTGGSRRQLLELFVAGESVLLGTATFWEGIDLPGQLLQCVVVAKLPFPVPDDPVVAGRSERYEDPFHEYHVPVAALRLRQGFGRLIRTRTDRGAVVLLDRRLGQRSYGEAFLRSLPESAMARPAVDAIGQVVDDWCRGYRSDTTPPL